MKNPATGIFNRTSNIWKSLGKNQNQVSAESSSSTQSHASSCLLNTAGNVLKAKLVYGQGEPDSSTCTCGGSFGVNLDNTHLPNDSGEGLDVMTRVDFLNNLPYEIGAYILNFVDVRTLGRVAQTCRGWNIVCQDNELWREMFRRQDRWKIRLPSSDPPRIVPSEPPTRKRKPLPLYHSRGNSKTPRRGSRASLFNVGDRRSSTASLANAHAEIAESELQLLSSLDWRELYRQRRTLEKRWQNGNVTTRYLSGHTDSVYCIQFDNRKIVTGSRDRSIKFWDINSGQCYYTLTGHEASVLCLHFDDKILVTGSSDSTIIVWDLQTCVQLHRLSSHSQGVLDICFDDNTIVSCSKDATIKIWDRHTGNMINTLAGHRGPVNAVKLHNGIIASASGDSYVKLWKASTGECIRDFIGHERGLACVRYDGTYIVSGSNDKTIKVWDPESGKCLRTLEGHLDLVRSLHFDSQRIVSGSYDQTIRVWDMATGRCLLDLRNGHASWIFDVEFDLSRIISTSQDQKILVWDFGTEDMNIDLFAS